MKAPGIVRKIDDLGRVVIPKELRRTFRIREGDFMEVFTGGNGEIVLKKYLPANEHDIYAGEYAESLSKAAGHTACIIKNSLITAVSGGAFRGLLNRQIGKAMEEALSRRETVVLARNAPGFIPLTAAGIEEAYNYGLVTPVISGKQIQGAVAFLSADKMMGEVEIRLARAVAEFLGERWDFLRI